MEHTTHTRTPEGRRETRLLSFSQHSLQPHYLVAMYAALLLLAVCRCLQPNVLLQTIMIRILISSSLPFYPLPSSSSCTFHAVTTFSFTLTAVASSIHSFNSRAASLRVFDYIFAFRNGTTHTKKPSHNLSLTLCGYHCRRRGIIAWIKQYRTVCFMLMMMMLVEYFV